MPRTRGAPAALAATALLLAGCATAAPADRAAVTVTNCGARVAFDGVPQRVVLLKSAAVPYLADLGVLDHVVARAGDYPAEYYDAATRAQLARIPLLTDRTDTGGHLRISRETVVAQDPDLVLGEVDGLDRATLAASGTRLLEEPALCSTGAPDRASFDDVTAQLDLYGRVFDRPGRATAAADALRARVDAVRAATAHAAPRTAAVLYPTVGGGVTYAYGRGSAATPQLAAAGFTNVFGDTDRRVFEVTREELLARDPDVLVLLHGDGDPAAVRAAVEDLPGASGMRAVRDGNVLVQLFNFTEPPTPLTVDGLERLVQRFGTGTPA